MQFIDKIKEGYKSCSHERTLLDRVGELRKSYYYNYGSFEELEAFLDNYQKKEKGIFFDVGEIVYILFHMVDEFYHAKNREMIINYYNEKGRGLEEELLYQKSRDTDN